MKRKILVIAPHLNYPFHDGADISIINLIRILSENDFKIDIAHSEGIINYSGINSLIELKIPKTAKYKKFLIAIKAILKSRSYSTEKFFTNKLRQHLLSANSEYHCAIYSYLGIYYESNKYVNTHQAYVWTHNNDLKWNDYKSNKIGFKRISNFVSHKATIKYLLSAEEKSAKLITVSIEDQIGYSKFASNIINVKIGIDQNIVKRLYTTSTTTDLPTLGFVGSLGNDMNLEALNYFRSQYWDQLKDVVQNFTVIGSNPSSEVLKIINANKWNYHYNLSQDLFNKEVSKLDFLVMPFKVNNGFKLKTLLSFKFGIPILSSNVIVLTKNYIGISSDDAKDWISFIEENYRKRKANEEYLHSQLKNYSWENSLQNLIQHISR